MAGEHHARRRAGERYGYDLTERDERRLCAKLASQVKEPTPDCVRLQIQSDGRERWLVWHKAEWMALIFAPETGAIVTFLPPVVVRDNRSRLPW